MAFKFENLEIWKLARSFVVEIYKITRAFPKDEIFGLTSQVRRAAVSIALNIAEGSHRGSDPDFHRFLVMARSSIDEVMTVLYIARDQNFVDDKTLKRVYILANGLSSKIMALMKKLK